MSLQEIEKSKGTFVDRTYYKDEEGRLVECIHHNGKLHDDVLAENDHAKANFNRHDNANIRHVASIPVDCVLKWLVEENIPGYCTPEAMDMIINKKLRDPEVKRLLTVPDNYRIKRYE